MRACVRACVRVCVRACVCVRGKLVARGSLWNSSCCLQAREARERVEQFDAQSRAAMKQLTDAHARAIAKGLGRAQEESRKRALSA